MVEQHSRVPEPLRQGPVLIGVFVVLALLAAAGTVLLLGGSVDHLMLGLVAGLFAAASIVGTYLLGRRFGQPHSHALAGSVVVFGVLLLVALVAELLYASGQVSNFEIGAGLGGTIVGTIFILALVGLLDRATTA